MTTSPRLVRIEAEHVYGIKAAFVEHIPERGLVPITGDNASGKSSLMRAVGGAIGGASKVHERFVNDDSPDGTGYIHLTLSEGWLVRRRGSKANPKGSLTVNAADGGKHGQAKLDELYPDPGPDILEFFSLPLARQTEILMGMGGDPDLPAKLAASKAEYREMYDLRTPAISDQRKARGVAKPEGERPEPIDVSAEFARLEVLQQIERDRNQAIADVKARCDAAARSALVARKEADKYAETTKTAWRDAKTAVANAEVEVANLRAKLHAAENALDVARNDEVVALQAAKKARDHAESGDFTPEAIPDPDLPEDPADEIAAVQSRIRRADAVVAELRPWEAYDAAQKTLAEAEEKIAAIEASMKDNETERLAMIEAAKIPVEGISFDAEGVPLYHGRPFELASGAEHVRVAVAVAKAHGAGFCLIDEGDTLSDKTLAELDALAKEDPGLQIVLCGVGLWGRSLVHVEDGVAKEVA